MVDRQDIDALLISALYGELTPADEARLTTHLESHPADKSALGFLTETRAAFRASGFSTVQVDPPQAISALLLQEAARRAPKVVTPRDEERVGWFARFVSSFARHPAMAAAAMLVLVAGVGGLIYSHQGNGSFADQTVSDERMMAPTGAATMAGSAAMAPIAPPPFAVADAGVAPIMPDPSLAAGSGSGSAYDSYRVDLAETSKGGKLAPSDHAGIVVTTPQPQVKELDDASDKSQLEMRAEKQKPKDAVVAKVTSPPKKAPATTAPEAAPGGRFETSIGSGYIDGVSKNSVVAGAGGGGNGNGQGSVNQQQVAPDSKTPAPPSPPPTVANTGADATVLAWAKDQHKRVTDYVHQNNCVDAAKVAAQISARANDYYNANVATDRGLKACQAYIQDQRTRDAERTQKAAAQKKVDANEVQPAPANVK